MLNRVFIHAKLKIYTQRVIYESSHSSSVYLLSVYYVLDAGVTQTNEQDVDAGWRGSGWFPRDPLLEYRHIQSSARSYTDHESIISFQGSNTEMANKAQACPRQYWLKQQMTYNSRKQWIILRPRMKENPPFLNPFYLNSIWIFFLNPQSLWNLTSCKDIDGTRG